MKPAPCRAYMAWKVLIGLFVVLSMALLTLPFPASRPDAATSRSVGTPIGTAGRASDGAGDRPVAATAPAIIRELETITGSNDGHELIGRKVDLHVRIQEHVRGAAFWIGTADNRILVVGPSRSRPASDDGPTAVAGTVQELPDAGTLRSWELRDADREELLQRKIYIRAEPTEH